MPLPVKLMIHMKQRLFFLCTRKRGFEATALQPDLTSCKLPTDLMITGHMVRNSCVFPL
jgi:hypothetical protein